VRAGRERVLSPDVPVPTVMTHGNRSTRSERSLVVGAPRGNDGELAAADMRGFAIGREWRRLKAGEQSGKYFNLVRPHLDRPLPTYTAAAAGNSAASVAHPTECRKFLIAELKRLCGFPDDFVLTGTYAQQWERLGRAVPPPMMAAVARAIRDEVLGRVEEADGRVA
jgi:DNA (cytosine-5)-methyltransferase 1